ncbi:MAG: hypothetical protein JOZ16_13950 [Methylobacteriaceae bacterium]|nr:hypothetical protein [Methylobacteriaceae bacterium]
MVEAQIRRLLITQTWRLIYDGWPNGQVLGIPLAPFQSLTAIRVYDASNAAEVVSASLYHVDAAPDMARIVFGAPPPNPGRQDAGIEVDVVVGYGAAPDNVPAPLRQAIRMLVTDWYENRGDAGANETDALPARVRALVAPYQRPKLA